MDSEQSVSAWKNGNVGGLQEVCKLADDKKSIENCIDEKTFDMKEVIERVLFNNIDVNMTSIKEEFGGEWVGRYFTFHVNNFINTNYNGSHINTFLAYNRTYEIFIHDSNFFALTFNPTIPFLRVSIVAPEIQERTNGGVLIYLEAIALCIRAH